MSQIRVTAEGFAQLEAQRKLLVEKIERCNKSIERAVQLYGIQDEQYLDRVDRRDGYQNDLDKLDAQLRETSVMDKRKKHKSVEIGCKVKLVNHKVCYMINLVSPVEADPIAGRVSVESPIGSTIFGKKLGDHVVVTLPQGEIDFEIVQIA